MNRATGSAVCRTCERARRRDLVLLALLSLLFVMLVDCVPAHAGLVGCVLAKRSDDEAVQLRLTTDQDSEVTITIGTNVITFAVNASEELSTGLLLIRGDSVQIDVFSDGVLTDQCTIPIDWIPDSYAEFCCDETPPFVTVSSDPPPNPDGWNHQTVTVTITADDGEGGSGIEAIHYRSPVLSGGNRLDVGRGELELREDGRIAVLSFELGRYDGSGVYDIECQAVDVAGNESEPESITLRLDFVAPTIELSTSSGDGGVAVTWEISDALSGLGESAVTLAHGSQQYALGSSSSGETFVSADTYGMGAFELTVWAIDRAENEVAETRPIELVLQRCSITGQVVDATNDEPVSGASVVLTPTDRRQTTDSQGRFTFADLPPNTYTVTAGKQGEYNTSSRTVNCVPSEPASVKLALSAIGEWRIVLSWNQDPSDLDSHLWTPEEHVWYDNKLGQRVQLDYDVTSGRGPETITILQWVDGAYTFAVKHYDGSRTLGTSGAQVEIYSPTSNEPIRTFTRPPCSTGVDTWWIVSRLHVSGGEVVEIEFVNACIEAFWEESASPPNP
jgi:hypothetical protein